MSDEKIIHGYNKTARDAAEEYARTYCEGGRKVGDVAASPNAALLFQFVGGVRWYAVRGLPDYSGWQVGPVEQ